ncbi:hypothetical protein [Halonotius roseus]|uniref:Phage baseplate assembly protein V n=1 Tax=Halonotius roseus TaxID=2511997 RepID=A0A544QQX4_9EURY|nr:hypothetical protein [Halonotius roseus]TQQ81845.1 hypothetical protein EWF95_02605 [Halonotius roseus]
MFAEPAERHVYVSVKVTPEEYYEKIAFATTKSGLWVVPEVGDMVEIYEIGRESYVARTPHNPPQEFDMPPLSEGDFCLKFNAETELMFSEQSDGSINLDVRADGNITLSATGETLDVVSAGDVNLTAASDSRVHVDGGDVVIGDEANAVGVAKADHTHPYVGGGDNSGSRTSGPPNEAGTTTLVE